MTQLGLFIAAMLVGLVASILPVAAEDVPALLDIPTKVASTHLALVQTRAQLAQEREALHAVAAQYNPRCGAVEEGSAEWASCRDALESFSADLEDHIRRSNEFNETVSTVAASGAAEASIEAYQKQMHEQWKAMVSQPWWGK